MGAERAREPGALRFRTAEEKDAAALAAISRSGFEPSWTADVFGAELAHSHTRALVLQRETELIGYAIGWRTLDEFELHQIAVLPAQRGQGLGEALLREFCAILQGEGCRRLMLDVRPGNRSARRLYESCGLELEGRRKRYYPDGEDALLYGGKLE